MSTSPIAIFAYAFPHRKTHDFLLEIATSGFSQVCVIAAPWRQLSHPNSAGNFPQSLRYEPPRSAHEICSAVQLQYHEAAHNDADRVTALRDLYGFKLGIISGARILKRDIINLFDVGIVNFHPGKIPETSGLDSFFYTIKKRVSLGVTAHFIDAHIDAGRQLFFEKTMIGPDDCPEIVQANNYQTQIRALRRLITLYAENSLTSEPIDHIGSNPPMSSEEKHQIIQRFAIWRAEQYVAQNSVALSRSV